MSTPQNPYGQQPNPYGRTQYPQQQPYPQQPGYAQYPQQPGYAQYPQQAGHPQAGHPQPAYGQQPHPAANGWGGPSPYGPPPVPPKKSRTGLIIGLSLGAVPLILLFAWFGNNVDLRSDRAGGGSGFPAAEYGLTAPKTLLDGTYELADDQSARRQEQLESSPVDESTIRDPQATVAQYTSVSEGGVLVISGMHGRIKDPATAREKILDGAATAEGATLSVPAKDFTPAGSEVTITCQVVTMAQDGGGTTPLPICAWADDNTNASVSVITAAGATQSPEKIDLAAAAETTAKVREETREPLG
ncbi:hypothetical protein AB0903_09325 [Streptomyces sp. NPDC048389]|uniref:hypothetical protein n=1 Tax=Streptomyces sp. NPDC048389 TaxID=3154622 RepID=UPI00345197E8